MQVQKKNKTIVAVKRRDKLGNRNRPEKKLRIVPRVASTIKWIHLVKTMQKNNLLKGDVTTNIVMIIRR